MQTALNIIILLALFSIALVLGLGLWNMAKGGSPNTSQRLMRLRVIAQAVAVLLLLAALAIFGVNR